MSGGAEAGWPQAFGCSGSRTATWGVPQTRTLFSDDFTDGIWTKHPGNPAVVRDQPWAESDYICEPSLLYVDGLFHLWFSQMYPPGGKTALGYATSPDGIAWTKHPRNPVLAPEGVEAHRPAVIRHGGTYYLFAVQHEQDARMAAMRRWSSPDGINWADERLVMTCTQPWEGGLSNMAVVVGEDGAWHMIYTGADEPGGPQFGYAWSPDGAQWTKLASNPVVSGFYGGDPFVEQIADRYYMWHSEVMAGPLRIACRRSRDLIHWERAGGHAEVNYTQPWERGVPPQKGGTTAGWYGHLTDATLCEAQGRVLLMYQGAQTPLGVASFDGTLRDLGRRLEHPPLSQWEASPFGMVDGRELKLADNDSERTPLVAKVQGAGHTYTVRARVRCYAGPTHRVGVVVRYADPATMARVWLHDRGAIYYEERLNGLSSLPRPVGETPVVDDAWHDWELKVEGRDVAVAIDGRPVGRVQSSEALLGRLGDRPVHIGFTAHDTWVAIDRVSVWG